MRKARKENPEATIDEIYNKVRRAVKHEFSEQQVDLIMGSPVMTAEGQVKTNGISSLITDLTDAEKKRIGFEAAKEQAQGNIRDIPEDQRVSAKTKEFIFGEDEIVEADAATAGLADVDASEFPFPIPPGMSRLQFLTSVEGVSLLDKASLPLGGYRSVDDRLIQALTTLRMFHGDDGLGLTKARIKKEPRTHRIASR